MKIDYVKPSESSVDAGEKFFSISDEAFIFEILRNKMYSNPILAVVREYACNALDAMIECGRGETPIEITLPSYNDLYFKVKDSGVGISPDRIENIYIKYAESTKRNDNNQIGGFGLGSKAGFAYSDSFTIITNFDGVKYNYACFIDETKLGKMALLSKEETSEPNGTTVIIPVKSYVDISYFSNALEHVCRHWSVKPIVYSGGSEYVVAYKKYDYIASGSTWALMQNSYSYYDREIKVILGNIEYILKGSDFKNDPDIHDIITKYRANLVLKINVGEVSLAANRESIQLDEKSKAAIGQVIKNAETEIDQYFVNSIAAIDNFYDAIVFYTNNVRGTYETSPTNLLNWNGKDIVNFNIGFPHYLFYRNSSTNKITRQQNHSVRFDSTFEKVRFYFNDTNVTDLTARHVNKLFGPENEIDQIIVFKSGSVNFEDFIKNLQLEDFEVEKLSNVLNNLKNYNFNRAKFIVSKLSGSKFCMSSINDVKADKNKIILCLLTKDVYNQKVPYFNNSNLSKKTISRLQSANSGVSIYGVDRNADLKKIEKIFPNFTWIEDFIASQYSISSEKYFESKYKLDLYYTSKQFFHSKIDFFRSNILNQNKLFGQYISLLNECSLDLKNNQNTVSIYEEVNGNTSEEQFHNWKELNEKIDGESYLLKLEAHYPMISFMYNNYNVSHVKNYEEKIVNYINLMDRT